MPTKEKTKTARESFPVVDGLPLRLSLVPDAIREHYADSTDVQRMSNTQLHAIASRVLTSDAFYADFHNALTEAFRDEYGFDPDSEALADVCFAPVDELYDDGKKGGEAGGA